MTIELYSDQADLVGRVRFSMRHHRWILMQSATGCHEKGHPILMFDGSVKPVENVCVGDMIMGPDSKPRIVQQLHSGIDRMYFVKPVKGEAFRVNAGHIFHLYKTPEKKGQSHSHSIATADEWAKSSSRFHHVHKLQRFAVNFPEASQSIPPWVMGVLLGDGSFVSGCPEISTADCEVLDEVTEWADTIGLFITTSNSLVTSPTYRIVGKKRFGPKNPLVASLQNHGIWGKSSKEKFVPDCYKIASADQRLEIIAGLIDTDGHLTGNGYDWISASEKLADDLVYLCRSVGLAAYKKQCKKSCQNDFIGTYYRVSISGHCDIIPCRVHRRKAVSREQKKRVDVTGMKLTPDGVGEYFGFEVDGDNFYLDGHFFCHHNSGKTRMALDMITGALKKGSRSIFAVPRRELLAQTIETMQEYGVPYGVISPDYTPDPFAPIQIAMTPTLARRLDRVQPPRVLFLDECHFGGAELESVIEWGKKAGSYGVGLSATPMKNNGKGMGDWYDHMEQGLPVADLIAQGRLSRYRYFGPSAPDLSGVQTRDGNYVQSQVASYMEEQAAIIGDAVKTYRETAAGKLCVVFATSRKHAGLIQQAFQDAGITAQTIDGTMDKDTRKRLVMGFARREYTVLINVLLLTFGFDLAQAASMNVRVEAISDMCPRKSLPMQMQVWGRALRAGDEPAVILDHANNWREHGFPDSPREWELTNSKTRQTGERNEPVRQCEACFFVHRPASTCPSCGHVYPVQSRMVDEVDGELRELDPEAMERARRAKRQEQGRADSLEGLLDIAKREGRNPRWAHHVWQARQRKRANA